MPKKKPKDDSNRSDKNKGLSKEGGSRQKDMDSNESFFVLTAKDIAAFRSSAGEASENLSDDDIRLLSESAQALGRSLGVEINKALLIELLHSQLADMAISEPGEGSDDSSDDSSDGAEAFDLDDWEAFAAQHFPSDFFDGADALEKAAAIADKRTRHREIADITKRYPAHGQSWLELARLQSSPDTAREYLHEALKANQWMLKLADTNPDRADGLRRAHVMLGLDVAGEFWMAGQRTDALEIQEQLLKIESKDVGGQRLIYAFRLLEQGWFDELDEQLVTLEKDTQSEAAIWLLKAFIHFVRDQDFEAAAKALRESNKINPMTFDTLLGGLDLEDIDQMDQASPEVEANWLGRVAMAPAASIDGLHRWMRDVLDYTTPEFDGEESENWEERIDELLQLPQTEAEWFLESRPLDGDYVTVIGETDDFELIGFDQQDRMLKPEDLWDVFIDTIEYPELDEPRRPGRLVVTAPALVKAWKETAID